MSMPFPTSCGEMTVGQLLAQLYQFNESDEVVVSSDGLPEGVARLSIRELGPDRAAATQATEAFAAAGQPTIVGYCCRTAEPRPEPTRRQPGRLFRRPPALAARFGATDFSRDRIRFEAQPTRRG